MLSSLMEEICSPSFRDTRGWRAIRIPTYFFSYNIHNPPVSIHKNYEEKPDVAPNTKGQRACAHSSTNAILSVSSEVSLSQGQLVCLVHVFVSPARQRVY